MTPVPFMSLGAECWRVLNRLFQYSMHKGAPVAAYLAAEQETTLEPLVWLHDHRLIASDTAVIQRDSTVCLDSIGKSQVCDNETNQVIYMLGMTGTSTVKALRTEAEATDDLLKGMQDLGLIQADPAEETEPLTRYTRIPNAVKVSLTRKGQRYVPR